MSAPLTTPTPGIKSRTGSRNAMFLRMLTRAALVNPGRAASALLAVVVAASVSTAMLNLFVDVQAKLRKEFRSYGANIVVVLPAGETPADQPAGSRRSGDSDALAKVKSALGGKGIAVPFGYAVARSGKDGSPVVIAGTDLDAAHKLNTWWSVTGWPSSTGQALLGVKAARVLSPDGKAFDLTYNGQTLHLEAAGTLRTGADEDSRVYLSLNQFSRFTGAGPSTIEINASGSTAEIADTVTRLSAALPGADVRPVRQIVEGEARVLGKTRASLLASIIVIILTAALCVLATLTAWVLDRRRDFAIMKALGASERLINSFFAAQAATLGVVGALAGFVIGIGVAAWIGRVNFHSAVSPRFSVLPIVMAGSVGLALLSAVLPISLLRRVQPAIILRGE